MKQIMRDNPGFWVHILWLSVSPVIDPKRWCSSSKSTRDCFEEKKNILVWCKNRTDSSGIVPALDSLRNPMNSRTKSVWTSCPKVGQLYKLVLSFVLFFLSVVAKKNKIFLKVKGNISVTRKLLWQATWWTKFMSELRKFFFFAWGFPSKQSRINYVFVRGWIFSLAKTILFGYFLVEKQMYRAFSKEEKWDSGIMQFYLFLSPC